MYCKNHINNKVTNTCSVCGEWICEECLLNIEDRNYCKDCLKETLENNNSLKKVENSQLKIKKHIDEKLSLKSIFSMDKKLSLKEILFYGISLIPGCGQICLGKSIKGIALLLLTFYSIYLVNSWIFHGALDSLFIGFSISLYSYSFFDALVLNRKIKKFKNNSDEISPNINKNPNLLLSLCYSLIPGCGQMYLGYTYYGFILSIISVVSMLLSEITVPLGIAIYLFSIFNTIYLRKQILNGVYFDDSIKSILEVIKPINSSKITKENIIDTRVNKFERKN